MEITELIKWNYEEISTNGILQLYRRVRRHSVQN